ncbi:hypothetical protein [Pontibacter vulgaris]|uniref:hypothetical protein n=1 Tax=Pontibacter vulgaris TaxID=2905679 RepID=UPI001FA7AB60|nr:hypothetical protein [Pontibacter vulgaris]
MLIKLFTLYVYLQATLCGCGADRRNSNFVRLRKDYKVKVRKIGRLEAGILESSGFAHGPDSAIWTHPDGGSPSELYLVSENGKLLQKASLSIKNKDWEDLAQDDKGNLYIGDFGNNLNTRQDLRVYKVQQSTMAVTDTIKFRFADQTAFPPTPQQRHYDLEAFFYHQDTLYLFTKSRALKSITRLYKLPATAGNYTLAPQQELQVKSPLTAADALPDASQFALLGYGRLYFFNQDNEQGISLSKKRYCLPLGRTGQAEAVLFLSPQSILVGNEKGKLYKVSLKYKNKPH